jgi:pyruvate,orthophosphate dikinase
MSAPLLVQISKDSDAGRMLVGGKAASLITLANHGAIVPPAFVLTTEAFRLWSEANDENLLGKLIAEGLSQLEAKTGGQLGAKQDPLIVSVRSGAPESMPGMMDTVLNVGIGSLDEEKNDFLLNARRRFLWQFAELVIGIEAPRLQALREEFEVVGNIDIASLESRLAEEAQIVNKSWPDSPLQELVMASNAVFNSWQSSRAKLYRRMRKIDDAIGSTVTIQQMVFGNRDQNSGSGVAFSRNPANGEPGINGEFLVGAQGEEIVAGKQTAESLDIWAKTETDRFAELEELARKLEQSTSKVQEIEFTVEAGNLYVLQCRPALLTARAAARAAVEMYEEGLLDQVQMLEYARSHGFDPETEPRALAVRDGACALMTGLPVGGGVAVGCAAFTIEDADKLIRAGESVVFVTEETSPELLPIMQKAKALVTMRGGASSHAAVVARQLGTPCVVGVGEQINDKRIEIGTADLSTGDVITVDGDSGHIYPADVSELVEVLTPYEVKLRKLGFNKDKAQAKGEHI